MRVLAIDTALEACAAAVLDTGASRVIASESLGMKRGHAEALMPLLRWVMNEAGMAFADIDRIAVTTGPGSFTGIRVGLAAVRGIALATGARPVGVTGFEAVAAGLATKAYKRGDGLLLVALESRRDELYVQLFDHACCPLGDPTAIMPAALDKALSGLIGRAPLVVAGDAAQRAADTPLPRSRTIVVEESAPDATGVLQAVLRRARGGEDRLKPLPLYLRPPDVTVSMAHQGSRR